MSDLIANFTQWVVDALYASGYLGVGVLTALGYLHLVVPTQLVLPLAGFLVGQGRFSFVPVLVASTVGGGVASIALYFPGLWVGEERVRQFVEKFGRFVFVNESDLDKASKLFERHGGKAVLIGHLIPGVTAFISTVAGLKRMPIHGWFLFYTIHRRHRPVERDADHPRVGARQPVDARERVRIGLGYAVLAAAALAILWFLWRRWKTHG